MDFHFHGSIWGGLAVALEDQETTKSAQDAIKIYAIKMDVDRKYLARSPRG